MENCCWPPIHGRLCLRIIWSQCLFFLIVFLWEASSNAQAWVIRQFPILCPSFVVNISWITIEMKKNLLLYGGSKEQVGGDSNSVIGNRRVLRLVIKDRLRREKNVLCLFVSLTRTYRSESAVVPCFTFLPKRDYWKYNDWHPQSAHYISSFVLISFSYWPLYPFILSVISPIQSLQVGDIKIIARHWPLAKEIDCCLSK